MATVPPYCLMRVDFALDHIREQAEKRQFFNAIQACAELQSLLLRGLREALNGSAEGANKSDSDGGGPAKEKP